ncbi:MAG TPA: hypothetical protein VHX68_00450 [Planctomycetaceae bacterium]|nr:hypothetical protein [Planctomycetaceae bacterium]
MPFRFRYLLPAFSIIVTVVFEVPVDAQLYQVVPPRSQRLRMRQSSPTDATGGNTRVTIEVFTGQEGTGLQAQQWESVFDRAGLLVRIHSPFPGDKISIKEKQLGKLREVYVVGKLERDGSLVFPGHKFAKSDSTAFEEWLRELKTYGAQGNPTGKAFWGLSQEQFEAMSGALTTPVQQEVAGLAFDEAIRTLQLPAKYPFRLSIAAEKRLDAPGIKQRLGKLQLRGFSHGTALAMLLSQYGLGFRPNRTPEGSLELVGLRSQDGQALWPVGWDVPEGTYPASVAPKLFQQTQVDLKDQKLIDVLEAIADRTGTPVRVDFASITSRDLDLDKILVNASGQHMTWSRLLANITSPSLLLPQIRTDEAKRPFVWVTSVKNPPVRLRRSTAAKKAAPPVRPELPADQ